MNKYGDLTAAEFAAKIQRGPRQAATSYNYPTHGAPRDLPPSQDWIKSGCIPPVANQGQCGSAVSFAALHVIEAYNCLKHQHSMTALSMQDLIDCTPGGCDGGFIDGIFKYCVSQGIDSESAYPTTGRQGPCHHTAAAATKCTSWHHVTPPGNETALTEVLAYTGPVACGIDASRSSFQFYSAGVYSDPECSAQQIDHMMVAVGYGATSDGTQFYNMQNSWGASWGMHGYMYLARNKGNMCGVATAAYWVTV